ncbi:MAG: DUF2065 domain-containing protein [Thiotrichales bacterium]|nr:MAG: DUF2065 domain-containing protein [Thiotrichales bacterium]
MWDDLVRAIALVLVIEGILPFLSPDGWRQAMIQAGRLSDRTLRSVGFASMLIGVLILYLTR